jgi:hypothetical protein
VANAELLIRWRAEPRKGPVQRPRSRAEERAEKVRSGIDPVRILKILFLRFHYQLSDRQVMERTTTDMAFRCFLAFPLNYSAGGADGARRTMRHVTAASRQALPHGLRASLNVQTSARSQP